MRQLEKVVMLRTIDTLWIDHLTAIDDLREGIGLRAYGQKDPLVEFKAEAHSFFMELEAAIQHDIVNTIYKVAFVKEPEPAPMAAAMPMGAGVKGGAAGQPLRSNKKVGRNDPCPCGSGKKYKKCHGK